MSLITTYSPLPISFTHGKGAWLYDEKGKQYLDSFSGIAVCNLGHAHPEITATISKQAAKVIHTSNAFRIKNQELLANKLTQLTGMNQVFFANSGAEANEAAIKITRLYAHQKAIANPYIIVMDGAFHGRTMATLTASNPKVQHGFSPLVPGFIKVPFNDFAAIEKLVAAHNNIVAIMLEPIQGEGGVHKANGDYLKKVASFCEQQELLLILDEIQTGVGRTGSLYTFLQHKITPDVVTSAKALGNGMPIGACLIAKKAQNLLLPGTHGSTFGGNPLACSVALTVLDIIEREKLCQKVQQNSQILLNKLHYEISSHKLVEEIRGQGYMLGVELKQDANAIKAIGLQCGILLNVTAGKVIRLLPPLIIDELEMGELVTRLTKALNIFTENMKNPTTHY